MNLLILDLMHGLCDRSFSTRIFIYPSRPENNINLHFETDVKENSLLLKLETLTPVHLKFQIHPFPPKIHELI